MGERAGRMLSDKDAKKFTSISRTSTTYYIINHKQLPFHSIPIVVPVQREMATMKPQHPSQYHPAQPQPQPQPQRSPFTPRSSRRLTSTNSLGTPSRPFIQPSSFTPPLLPPLSLRPLPKIPYANDPSFAHHRARDIDAIDVAVNSMKAAASEHKKDVAEAMASIDEEKRRILEACRNLGDHAKEIGISLQNERKEADEAKEKDGEVAKRGRVIQVQLDALSADVAEVRAKVAARREG